jgi:hypothetical protein
MRIVHDLAVTANRYIKLFFIPVIGTIHTVHNYQDLEEPNPDSR